MGKNRDLKKCFHDDGLTCVWVLLPLFNDGVEFQGEP